MIQAEPKKSGLISYRFPNADEQRDLLNNKNTPLDPYVITGKTAGNISAYNPTDEEKTIRQMIVRHFTQADNSARKPRREFNDLSLFTRADVDRMAWNNYQPNDGDALQGDEMNAWKCVSADTEILTMEGWKGIGDIKVGDAVLSYDIETDTILSDVAKSYHEYDVDGEMYSIKNKHTDQLITTNHRTLVKKWERTTVDGKRIRTWWDKYQYVEAKDLDYSTYDFPLASFYDGDTSIGEDWAELVGWFLTDGYIKGSDCYLTQSKPDTLLKLRTLLDSMGVEYREWSRPKKDKDGSYGHYHDEHRFYFLVDSVVAKRMKELIPNRKPTNQLLHLKLVEKQRLLLGLCLGDGSFDKEYGHYSSIHKPYQDFKEWIQTLLHLMGIVGTISDNYVALKYSTSIQVISEDRSLKDYFGKIWSIETERTNYIARRNGHIFITGNSNAQRPIVRNKIISIAAHATARLIFPKIDAWNEENEVQHDSGQVMEDLMEWSGDQSDYAMTALKATIESLSQPACITFTEYAETQRQVKEITDNGGWVVKTTIDKILSGFKDAIVPVTELYIENFYESDLQKQGWLLWRRVHSYSLMKSKYGHYDNFQFVHSGVQTIYDDANRLFYEVYDSNMRQHDCEEIIYWNRSLDLKIIMVNGVMLTPYDNPNPRLDKLYPFAKFGYELINPNFFYYKSLASKMMQDAKIINSLYQMVIDGTYLQLFPPLKNIGSETITSDVLIPGAAITLSSPNSDISPIMTGGNIGEGLNAMMKVEQSINETSGDEWMMAAGITKRQTAYAMSIMQQNANSLLGLFIQMISQFVKDYGKLRLGDIVQYLTIADVQEVEGDTKLVFKSFILPNKQSNGKNVNRRISFDHSMPTEPITKMDALNLSYETMEKQGGAKSKNELWRVAPELFRTLTFHLRVNPDTLNPMSTELEKQYGLEEFDRMVAAPQIFDPEQTGRVLLELYPATKKDPDKYIAKVPQGQPTNTQDPLALMKQMGQNKGQGGTSFPTGNMPVKTPSNQQVAQRAGVL